MRTFSLPTIHAVMRPGRATCSTTGPLGSIMPGLVQSYEDEIGRLSQTEANDDKSDRANRLSEYLGSFRARRRSSRANGAVLEGCVHRLRQHAMWFLGRHILAAKDIEPKALDRARSYWETRIATAQAGQCGGPFKKEIGAMASR